MIFPVLFRSFGGANTYLLAEYASVQGKETHNVAIIMSNPEQSKHLETARMKIHGLWIDLVNLRSEEYAQNSRIPTMTVSDVGLHIGDGMKMVTMYLRLSAVWNT